MEKQELDLMTVLTEPGESRQQRIKRHVYASLAHAASCEQMAWAHQERGGPGDDDLAAHWRASARDSRAGALAAKERGAE